MTDTNYKSLFAALVAKTAEGKLKWRETAQAGKLVTVGAGEMMFSLLNFKPNLCGGEAILLTVFNKYGEATIKILSGRPIAVSAFTLAELNIVQPRQEIAEALQLLESL